MLIFISMITTKEEADVMVRSFQDHYGRLCRRAKSRGAGEDAEDIVQEVYARVARNPKGFMEAAERSDLAALGYLCHAVDHCLADLVRRRERQKAQPLDTTDPWLYLPTQCEDFRGQVHMRVLIQSALEQMSDPNRHLMVLYFHDGYTCREIGDMVGASEAAVTSQVHRLRAKLRKEVRDDEAACY